jgi:hypothetical protein
MAIIARTALHTPLCDLLGTGQMILHPCNAAVVNTTAAWAALTATAAVW